uniref:Nodulin-related protein 1 n=1 Tax=Kalanchoe fedtschenkoi TaxID=63787 RepID=A0A7N0TRX8_KALFE
MDFFNKAVSAVTHQTEEPKGGESKQHSTSELFSSAQVVAGAAQATLSNQSDKVDKKEVAGAAGDLLGAAREYGKLEEDKGLGAYVGQAETYLRSYGAPAPPAGDAPTAEKVAPGAEHPAPAAAEPPAPAAAEPPAPAVAVEEEKKVVEEEEKEGGAAAGAADYFKVAEGFLKK